MSIKLVQKRTAVIVEVDEVVLVAVAVAAAVAAVVVAVAAVDAATDVGTNNQYYQKIGRTLQFCCYQCQIRYTYPL